MTTAHPTRRRLAKGLLAGLFAALAGTAFGAADFPQKPITLVVPFAAGGGLDVTARILADKLKDLLGQPVLISNKPGAGSSVGARAVAAAPADGYTLFITSGSAYGYLHLLTPNLDLRLDDFVPVASVASNPSIIAVSTSIPVKTLGELVDYGRSKPGVISFCSTGAGGLNHLQLEMLKRLVKAKTRADFEVTHVPYNGLAPALVGVKGQSVQACTLPYTALVKNMEGKDLRIVAVQSRARLPWLPNVPTTGEQGYPEMDANDAFINIAAPKGTPQPVIARLEGAFQQVMKDPDVKKKLEALEVQGLFMNSQDTRKWLEDDVKRFSTIIREAGLVTAATAK
jgi:tripartite-type tricarboxylate transporter receptor subunit TctC